MVVGAGAGSTGAGAGAGTGSGNTISFLASNLGSVTKESAGSVPSRSEYVASNCGTPW